MARKRVPMTTTSNNPNAVIRANHIAGPKQGNWTYSHYATLPDDGNRYEIIDGVLYMAPAPNLWHQKIGFEIASYLRTYIVSTESGEIFTPPTDVQLAPNIVIQPDVIVVLNEHFEILQGTRIIGTPDLVVEVASPSTATYDRRQKYDVYERAGVAEYWLVDPGTQTVEIRTLEGDTYQLLGIFTGEDTISSKIVPTLQQVKAKQFFAKRW